ncbi:hypothetical protein [Leeia aquatica]|uniref:Uncharacterized protein n=1 Tax=Leeia aquatica TaxID=2725557 RepID=A0A847RY91_9NEIS|nr:hypothetical protein [Leeia aquatica]NLR74691.1 hypothetical protein [Leeia aquatica]
MKRTQDVFGMSSLILPDSYVDRGSLDGILTLLTKRNIHVAIRGPSKCGKSWLRQKVTPNALVVQCRHGFTNINIYETALAQLGIELPKESIIRHGSKEQKEGSITAGNDLIGKLSAKATIDTQTESSRKTEAVGLDVNNLQLVAKEIVKSGRRLIIEDVHYLSTEQREALSFDLKALWDLNCFATIVGVWGDANMFVSLNTDLSGRLEEISIEWSIEELFSIIENGSRSLNIQISKKIQTSLVGDAFGNAGLLQILLLKTLDEFKITQTQPHSKRLEDTSKYKDAAMHVAEQLNAVYLTFGERVAKGIRHRNDSTGIYAHAMEAIIKAPDKLHMSGIPVDYIYENSIKRQPRIQKSNLKTILSKIDSLQVDNHGRGLVVTYDRDKEWVLNVDRQLLFYRKYQTAQWPWENLISATVQQQLTSNNDPQLDLDF